MSPFSPSVAYLGLLGADGVVSLKALPPSFLPPPTLVEVLHSFQLSGGGDRDLLLAILSAKKSEDERLTAQWAVQTQSLSAWAEVLHRGNAGLIQGGQVPAGGRTTGPASTARAPSKRSRDDSDDAARAPKPFQRRGPIELVTPPAESMALFPSAPLLPSQQRISSRHPIPPSPPSASSFDLRLHPSFIHSSSPSSSSANLLPPFSRSLLPPPSSLVARPRSVSPKTTLPTLPPFAEVLADGHARAMNSVRARLEAARRERAAAGSDVPSHDSEGQNPDSQPPVIVVSASSRPSSAILSPLRASEA